jgi:hypothetical protein
MPPTFDQSDPITCGNVVTGIIEITDDPDEPITFELDGKFYTLTGISRGGHPTDAPITAHLAPKDY